MSDSPPQFSARSAGIVSLAVMCSRILGLVREVVFMYLFGASRGMDAFYMAFRTPNMLRDLFAEGALSTAFVTTFSKKIAREGEASAWALANKIATLTAVFMSAVTLLGIAFAPVIIAILAPKFTPEKAALTVQLARIMYPFILMVSLAALVMGMLNAKRVFGMPAMASTFFNVGSILGGVGLGWWFDPHFGERSLIGLAIGTLVGGCLQLAVQLPALARVGFKFRADFQWRDDGVREVLRLMGPAVIAASSVQVNVVINSMFASGLGDGPISWLQVAFRLMQLPLGMFGVAIGTVTLPLISRSAAMGNMEEFRGTMAKGLRLAFLLTVPSTIGLVLLAEPIIGIIYERGRFSADMTMQTAAALQFYAIGLAAYSAMKVLAPAFYAIDQRRTPMVVSLIAIATNAGLNALFVFVLGWGHRGLALSTGCVALINFAILYGLMTRHTHGLETPRLVITLVKLFAAGALLAAVCWLGNTFLLPDFRELHFLSRAARLSLIIATGAAVFFVAAWALRIEEMQDLALLIRKRWSRGRRNGATKIG